MSYQRCNCSSGRHCVHLKKAELRVKVAREKHNAAKKQVYQKEVDLNFHLSQYEKFTREVQKSDQYSEKIEKLITLVNSAANDEVLIDELTDLIDMTKDTQKKYEIQKTANKLRRNIKEEDIERQRQLCIAAGFTDIYSPD